MARASSAFVSRANEAVAQHATCVVWMSLNAAGEVPGRKRRPRVSQQMPIARREPVPQRLWFVFFRRRAHGLGLEGHQVGGTFQPLRCFCSFLAFFRASSLASSGVLEKVKSGGGASGSSEDESEP